VLLQAVSAVTLIEKVTDARINSGQSVPYTTEELQQLAEKNEPPYTLDFNRFAVIHPPKLDPGILANPPENKASPDFTYAYVMMDGEITSEKLEQLYALGVVSLGYQAYHSIRARIPLSKLEALEKLPFVISVSYRPTAAKLGGITSPPEDNATNQYMVFVYDNTFSDVMRDKIQSSGAKIVGHSDYLNYYLITATNSIINNIADLDFVDYVEQTRLTVATLDKSRAQVSLSNN